jgi:hypothetical protein
MQSEEGSRQPKDRSERHQVSEDISQMTGDERQ